MSTTDRGSTVDKSADETRPATPPLLVEPPLSLESSPRANLPAVEPAIAVMPPTPPDDAPASGTVSDDMVTLRAFLFGLVFSIVLAVLSCRLQSLYLVHFLGGVQMPFGAIFGLLFTIAVPNFALRGLHRISGRHWLRPFSSVELLTIYSMLLMSSLVSTLGNGNFFLTSGAAMFYFATPENRWANLLYAHVPSWFAPGWDGHTYQKEVIEHFYLGGLSFSQIPWHAWVPLLTGWGIFLVFMYGVLFFMALLFRKQWVEHEALAFPLAQLPMQMVDMTGADGKPTSRQFWSSHTMWCGFGLAFVVHFTRGMNNLFPDWPVMSAFQGNTVGISFPDKPWNSIGGLRAELYLGAIGLAYLLTNDVVFSLWFFYFFVRFQYVFLTMVGIPPVALTAGVLDSDYNLRGFQNSGAWLMMAILLLWTARLHITQMVCAAWTGSGGPSGEPFTPRFVMMGLLLSLAGLVGWGWFAGISLFMAILFFVIFMLSSLVVARIVVEAGFLYPEMPFYPVECLTSGFLGGPGIGDGNLVRLAFVQPVLMSDMRTSTLPAFLHILKLAHVRKMSPRSQRRLLGAALAAIAVAAIATVLSVLAAFYDTGALTSYKFFAIDGAQDPLDGTANIIKIKPGVDPANWGFMAMGATLVWGMMLARSRWLWFPLHPAGYLVASAYGIKRLWLSLLIGQIIKVSITKFAGTDHYVRFRPFMIGLILGNATAMVFWMLIGFYRGSTVTYWPA